MSAQRFELRELQQHVLEIRNQPPASERCSGLVWPIIGVQKGASASTHAA